MKREYLPQTLHEKLAWLSEECGEVVAAIGKTWRFGVHSSNPELPEDKRETNGEWILREVQDLKEAIRLVEEELGLSGIEPPKESNAESECTECNSTGYIWWPDTFAGRFKQSTCNACNGKGRVKHDG